MNRFAPLTPQEIASAAIAHDAPDKDAAVCIMPAPHDAPPLPQKHSLLGQPSMRWSYHVADGLLYEVWRFDPPGERKQSAHALARRQWPSRMELESAAEALREAAGNRETALSASRFGCCTRIVLTRSHARQGSQSRRPKRGVARAR